MRLGNSLKDRLIAFVIGIILIPIMLFIGLLVIAMSVTMPIICFIKPSGIKFKK